MANVLTDSLWVIDTVDADVISTASVKVKNVRWVAGLASVANDAVIIRDPVTNTTLWETTASGANYVESDLIHNSWVNGFEVPTLDRGILYISLA